MSDDCVNFIFENSAVPVIPSNTDSGTVLSTTYFGNDCTLPCTIMVHGNVP